MPLDDRRGQPHRVRAATRRRRRAAVELREHLAVGVVEHGPHDFRLGLERRQGVGRRDPVAHRDRGGAVVGQNRGLRRQVSGQLLSVVDKVVRQEQHHRDRQHGRADEDGDQVHLAPDREIAQGHAPHPPTWRSAISRTFTRLRGSARSSIAIEAGLIVDAIDTSPTGHQGSELPIADGRLTIEKLREEEIGEPAGLGRYRPTMRSSVVVDTAW